MRRSETPLAEKDVAGALVEYGKALALREAVADKDPTNADRRDAIAEVDEKVGDALAAKGDAAGAQQEYRAALLIADDLARRDPTDADLRKQVDGLTRKVHTAPRR
jgi:hypothetical protein